MTLSLRPAVEGDLDAIADVHSLARRAYYGDAASAIAVAGADHRDEWRSVIDDADAELTVALDRTRVVAFIASAWSQDPALAEGRLLELAALYVLPAYWGTGLASRLHLTFLAHLERVRAAAGVLDVWDGNARALGFYAKHGWVSDGRSRSGSGGNNYIGLRLPRDAASRQPSAAGPTRE